MSDIHRSPWTVLGLDYRANITQSEVKRAYARLIKLHRPESDPEGFQRVHQAYQIAMAQLARPERAEQIPSASASPQHETNPQQRARPVWKTTEAFQAAESEVVRALASGDLSALAAALDAFRPMMKSDPESKFAWGDMAYRLFEHEVPALANCLPPPGVVRLVEARQVGPALAVLNYWRENGSSENVEVVARLLQNRAPTFSHLEQSLCIAQVACMLAYEQPILAEALANAVFSQLPPGYDRDRIMQQIEHRMSLGKVFGSLNPIQAKFWEARLLGGEDPRLADWSSHEAKSALNYIGYSAPLDWPGYSILQQILPEEIWRKLESRVQGRHQTFTASQATPLYEPPSEGHSGGQYRRRRSSTRQPAVSGRVLFWLFFIVVKLIIIFSAGRR